jgi:hypothetical protein
MYLYNSKINKNEQIILLEMCYCACLYNGYDTWNEILVYWHTFFEKVMDTIVHDFFYSRKRTENQ